ncbi:GIY-YIG nuclease family protein [Clostridium butyricum]|uniref:GIY-YIG nuclease family protein n=1 Tax=Clostridium butyricum TaxID=1492 RepID=UPI00374FC46C
MQKNIMIMNIIDMFVENIANSIDKFLIIDELNSIRNSDGRKNDAPKCCKKGSFIYFLYDSSDEVIYIGETGQTVKNRLYIDGSGAHCNKVWFKEVVKLKYYSDTGMDFNSRKVLERALISKYKPKYNDNKSLK